MFILLNISLVIMKTKIALVKQLNEEFKLEHALQNYNFEMQNRKIDFENL